MPQPTTATYMSSNNSHPNNNDTQHKNNKKKDDHLQVAVRVRPMLPSEYGSVSCIDIIDPNQTTIRIGGEDGPTFCFDRAFDGTATQQDVYQTKVVPLLNACLEGYNATVLAYGQTGSGKTHSIMGSTFDDDDDDQDENDQAGIIPRALHDLFQHLDAMTLENNGNVNSIAESKDDRTTTTTTTTVDVRVQFLELYGEDIRDLLSHQNHHHHRSASSTLLQHSNHSNVSRKSSRKKTSTMDINPSKLTIREIHNEPEVLGATTQKVTSAEEALMCLTRGMLRRVTGATAMNASSSRSHAILCLQIEITQGNSSRRSKFNFVDLAGSERQKRTQSSGQRLKEGIDINKGLLVLGNVISALTSSNGGGGGATATAAAFVPYRDSKLTRLLKGSLGGNHKTLMLACVSPSSSNLEESINCLRYANRAKNIQNNAIVNLDAGSQLILELKGEIHSLASVLLMYVQDYGQIGNNIISSGGNTKLYTVEALQQLLQEHSESSTMTTDKKKSNTSPLKQQRKQQQKQNRYSSSLKSSSLYVSPTSPQRISPPPQQRISRPPLMDIPPTTPTRNNGINNTFSYNDTHSPSISGSSGQQQQQQQQNDYLEQELGRIRELLRQSKRELIQTQEELYATKAEKELYRLQLQSSEGGTTATFDNIQQTKETNNNKTNNNPEDDIPRAQDNDKEEAKENHPQQVFYQRTIAYEKEISTLKQSLRNANAQLEQHQHRYHDDSSSMMIPPPPILTPNVSASSPVITRATKILQEEKAQLSYLQQQHSNISGNNNDSLGHNDDTGELGHSSSESAILKAKALQSISPALQLDAEEAAEEAALDQMKQKYIVDEDDLDHEEGDATNADLSTNSASPTSTALTPFANNKNKSSNSSSSQTNKRQVKAHLFELSTSIAAKEELIEQLEMSLQKYAAMREFYETKLKQMEEQVAEREAERLQLLEELMRVDNSDKQQVGGGLDGHRNDLEEKLKAKETHIATLRKRKSELVNLTQVSSQNEADIDKLQRDVVDMKQKKVELQKLLTQSNKVHATEMKRMKKDIVQKDRETAKLRKELTVKSSEASKAKLVAKARLEELSTLRTKFKESEKKLRVQIIKRRMMEKAGLDSVMVGRTTNTGTRKKANNTNRRTIGRQQYSYGRTITDTNKTRSTQDSNDSPSQQQSKVTSGAAACIDFDALRDYLDEKVADVGRKETIALKIASEWEDHYEIVQQRDELLRQSKDGSGDSREHLDRIEALEIQAQYKESRIRLFSKRLGRGATASDQETNDAMKEDASSAEDAIFRDRGFKSICKGISGTNAVKSAARALFGMVVRERRRVISLAKTASQLDDRLVQAESDLAEKEEAIRTYIEEDRIERSNMALNQQEKILSLMELVQLEDKTPSVDGSKNTSTSSTTPTTQDGNIGIITTNAEKQHLEDDRTRSLSIMGQSSSKMLIMANERVSVLEEQLRELEGSHEAMLDYQEKEKSTRSMLTEKTNECDDLKKNNADLHSTLWKVHEYLLGMKETTKETNLDESERGYLNEVLDIVMDALKEGRGEMRSGNSIKDSFSSSRQPRTPNRSVLTPRLSRQIELLDSTESDDDLGDEGDNDPDWAGDIMKDLAIIAEGGLPSAHRERSLSAADEKQVVANESSVFDRLTNPGNFTGVQKQKTTLDNTTNRTKRDTSILRAKRDSAPAIAKHSKLESPSGLTVSIPSSSPSKSNTTQQIPLVGRSKNKKSDKNETNNKSGNEERSVFERLVSPSNYTGIHKEKAVIQQEVKKAEETSPETDELLDELLADDVVEYDGDPVSYEVPDSIAGDHSISKTKNDEYAGKDVFERLQNTMTQSYAIKAHHNPVRPISSDLSSLASATDEHISPTSFSQEVPADQGHEKERNRIPKESIEDYTKKNVFERLQQTTTQAYAKKKNPTIDYHAVPWNHENSSMVSSDGGHFSAVASIGDTDAARRPSTTHHTDIETYTQQNVFERLQNTVTASYAVRKNVPNGKAPNKPM